MVRSSVVWVPCLQRGGLTSWHSVKPHFSRKFASVGLGFRLSSLPAGGSWAGVGVGGVWVCGWKNSSILGPHCFNTLIAKSGPQVFVWGGFNPVRLVTMGLSEQLGSNLKYTAPPHSPHPRQGRVFSSFLHFPCLSFLPSSLPLSYAGP